MKKCSGREREGEWEKGKKNEEERGREKGMGGWGKEEGGRKGGREIGREKDR